MRGSSHPRSFGQNGKASQSSLQSIRTIERTEIYAIANPQQPTPNRCSPPSTATSCWTIMTTPKLWEVTCRMPCSRNSYTWLVQNQSCDVYNYVLWPLYIWFANNHAMHVWRLLSVCYVLQQSKPIWYYSMMLRHLLPNWAALEIPDKWTRIDIPCLSPMSVLMMHLSSKRISIRGDPPQPKSFLVNLCVSAPLKSREASCRPRDHRYSTFHVAIVRLERCWSFLWREGQDMMQGECVLTPDQKVASSRLGRLQQSPTFGPPEQNCHRRFQKIGKSWAQTFLWFVPEVAASLKFRSAHVFQRKSFPHFPFLRFAPEFYRNGNAFWVSSIFQFLRILLETLGSYPFVSQLRSRSWPSQTLKYQATKGAGKVVACENCWRVLLMVQRKRQKGGIRDPQFKSLCPRVPPSFLPGQSFISLDCFGVSRRCFFKEHYHCNRTYYL